MIISSGRHMQSERETERRHMKIGILQLGVCDDKSVNLNQAVENIGKVAREGADIAVLGEMFLCPYDNESFVLNAEDRCGAAVSALSRAAESSNVYVIGGSIPLRENGRLYNASFVFNRKGEIIACHKKIHMFDIDVEGGQSFKESATFSAGDSVTEFETEFGRMGLCICFDMRFPELARIMTLDGAKCVFAPAAFNMTTGPAHWETMFRQRAVDNQIYTVGVAPARGDSGYISYANSIIVSPWGDIVYRADEKPVTEVVDIDLSTIEKVRSQLPLISARRTDLYSVVKKDPEDQ